MCKSFGKRASVNIPSYEVSAVRNLPQLSQERSIFNYRTGYAYRMDPEFNAGPSHHVVELSLPSEHLPKNPSNIKRNTSVTNSAKTSPTNKRRTRENSPVKKDSKTAEDHPRLTTNFLNETYEDLKDKLGRLRDKLSNSTTTSFCEHVEGCSGGMDCNCPRGTEKITSTKIGGTERDYVQETIIERSILTDTGVKTTTKHVIRRCDKTGNIDVEVDETKHISGGENQADASTTKLYEAILAQGRETARDNNSNNNNRYRRQCNCCNTPMPPVDCRGMGAEPIGYSNTPTNRAGRARGRCSFDDESPPCSYEQMNNSRTNHVPLECCPHLCRVCANQISQRFQIPPERCDPDTLNRMVHRRPEDGKACVDYSEVGKVLTKDVSARQQETVCTASQTEDNRSQVSLNKCASAGASKIYISNQSSGSSSKDKYCNSSEGSQQSLRGRGRSPKAITSTPKITAKKATTHAQIDAVPTLSPTMCECCMTMPTGGCYSPPPPANTCPVPSKAQGKSSRTGKRDHSSGSERSVKTRSNTKSPGSKYSKTAVGGAGNRTARGQDCRDERSMRSPKAGSRSKSPTSSSSKTGVGGAGSRSKSPTSSNSKTGVAGAGSRSKSPSASCSKTGVGGAGSRSKSPSSASSKIGVGGARSRSKPPSASCSRTGVGGAGSRSKSPSSSSSKTGVGCSQPRSNPPSSSCSNTGVGGARSRSKSPSSSSSKTGVGGAASSSKTGVGGAGSRSKSPSSSSSKTGVSCVRPRTERGEDCKDDGYSTRSMKGQSNCKPSGPGGSRRANSEQRPGSSKDKRGNFPVRATKSATSLKACAPAGAKAKTGKKSSSAKNAKGCDDISKALRDSINESLKRISDTINRGFDDDFGGMKNSTLAKKPLSAGPSEKNTSCQLRPKAAAASSAAKTNAAASSAASSANSSCKPCCCIELNQNQSSMPTNLQLTSSSGKIIAEIIIPAHFEQSSKDNPDGNGRVIITTSVRSMPNNENYIQLKICQKDRSSEAVQGAKSSKNKSSAASGQNCIEPKAQSSKIGAPTAEGMDPCAAFIAAICEESSGQKVAASQGSRSQAALKGPGAASHADCHCQSCTCPGCAGNRSQKVNSQTRAQPGLKATSAASREECMDPCESFISTLSVEISSHKLNSPRGNSQCGKGESGHTSPGAAAHGNCGCQACMSAARVDGPGQRVNSPRGAAAQCEMKATSRTQTGPKAPSAAAKGECMDPCEALISLLCAEPTNRKGNSPRGAGAQSRTNSPDNCRTQPGLKASGSPASHADCTCEACTSRKKSPDNCRTQPGLKASGSPASHTDCTCEVCMSSSCALVPKQKDNSCGAQSLHKSPSQTGASSPGGAGSQQVQKLASQTFICIPDEDSSQTFICIPLPPDGQSESKTQACTPTRGARAQSASAAGCSCHAVTPSAGRSQQPSAMASSQSAQFCPLERKSSCSPYPSGYSSQGKSGDNESICRSTDLERSDANMKTCSEQGSQASHTVGAVQGDNSCEMPSGALKISVISCAEYSKILNDSQASTVCQTVEDKPATACKTKSPACGKRQDRKNPTAGTKSKTNKKRTSNSKTKTTGIPTVCPDPVQRPTFNRYHRVCNPCCPPPCPCPCPPDCCNPCQPRFNRCNPHC